MSVNKVILVGNVGKDPETRYLDEGTAISKFPLATSESYKNKDGERITTTEWHNVVLWRGLAQVAEKYVRKGTQLYIEGRIKTRSYDDSEGNRKYTTEIVGDQMQMLGRRPDDSGDQGQGGSSPYAGSSSQGSGGSQGTGSSSQGSGGSQGTGSSSQQGTGGGSQQGSGSSSQQGSGSSSQGSGSSSQGSARREEQEGIRSSGPDADGNSDEIDAFGSENEGPDDLPF